MLPGAARLAAANGAVVAGSLPALARFRRSLAEPGAAQQRLLARLLERIAPSDYGRRHGLDRVRDAAALRHAAPSVRHDELAPWIERIAAGERDVLTTEEVLLFERTSGSSAAAKLIPYTRSLLEQFDGAVSAWLADVYLHRPGLLTLGSYWSISPLAADAPRRTAGGIPVGVEDDGAYLGPLVRRLVEATRLVPASVRHIPDLDACRYVSLRYLLQDDRLGLVSVWSPSFWTLFCDALERRGPDLLRDLADGGATGAGDALGAEQRQALRRALPARPRRARALTALLEREGRLRPDAAWPRLRLLSCWTSASAARQVPALRERFPATEIQGKGLLATEGVATVPLTGHAGAAPALDAHFLELLPVGGGDEEALGIHELDAGQDYELLMTTGSGLVRYRLGDVVRVVGRIAASPLLELVGRADGVVDLAGEKLSEAFAASVLEAAAREAGLTPRFAMLAPADDAPTRYLLLLEADAPRALLERHRDAVERGLGANPHYAYCARLGQLAPVELVEVRDAEARALAVAVERGQRAGDVKPVALSPRRDWRARLAAPRPAPPGPPGERPS